jgi:hypothetical protein
MGVSTSQMEDYKTAYRAAFAETRKAYADVREAKDRASAIATAVAFGHPVRDSAASRAAAKSIERG